MLRSRFSFMANWWVVYSKGCWYPAHRILGWAQRSVAVYEDMTFIATIISEPITALALDWRSYIRRFKVFGSFIGWEIEIQNINILLNLYTSLYAYYSAFSSLIVIVPLLQYVSVQMFDDLDNLKACYHVYTFAVSSLNYYGIKKEIVWRLLVTGIYVIYRKTPRQIRGLAQASPCKLQSGNVWHTSIKTITLYVILLRLVHMTIRWTQLRKTQLTWKRVPLYHQWNPVQLVSDHFLRVILLVIRKKKEQTMEQCTNL